MWLRSLLAQRFLVLLVPVVTASLLPPARAVNVAEYFPVNPGAQWEYTLPGGTQTRRVDAATLTLHGSAASGFRITSGAQFQGRQWWSASAGLQLHRVDEDETAAPKGLRFKQALGYLPADVSVGTAMDSIVGFAQVASGAPDPAVYPGEVEVGTQVEAAETLTTAAGKFDCLRVGIFELWMVNGTVTYSGSSTMWIAKGVGMVRLSDDTGTLELKAFSGSSQPALPAITSSPQGASVTVGARVSLSVTATGTTPLAYQWRKDGVNVAGATQPTFVIQAVALSDAGSYTVDVSNVAGHVASAAAVVQVTPGGGGADRPSITGCRRLAGGDLELTFTAPAGRAWTFESSDDLANWSLVAGVKADGPGVRAMGLGGGAARKFFRIREAAVAPGKLTLPVPGQVYPEGTTLGGDLFGLEFTVPPRWKGGLRVNSSWLLFGSDTEPGLILAILGFGGDRASLLADPSLNTGFDTDIGGGNKLHFRAVRPVAVVADNRLSAGFQAVGADGQTYGLNAEIVLHPSGGMIGFLGLTLASGMDALQARVDGLVKSVKTTVRPTIPEYVTALQGRSFKWESGGNEWYRGDWQSSLSSTSWGESYAFFCADGSFELNRESTSYISSRNSSGWSSTYMDLSYSSTTREYGQYTIVRNPQYGDLMLISTLSGYTAAPVRFNADGSVLIGSNRLTPYQIINCH